MKKILSVLFSLFIVFAVFSVNICAEDEYQLLQDVADVLTDAEESALLSSLNGISEKHKCSISVVIIPTLDGQNVEDASNEIFESYGYGYGDTDDGMTLLLVMDSRDYSVSKNGFAREAFIDAGIEYIIEKIKSDLGDDKFADALTSYAEYCDDFLAKARAGEPYTKDTLPKDPFDPVVSAIISVVVGFVIAFIVTGSMKGKLKTVRARSEASDYTKSGSLNVTESRDFFLYKTVSRTEKKRDDDSDSGGGSSRNVSGKF